MTVTDRPADDGTNVIRLGQFEIDLGMRTLRQSGAHIPLGSRAFDILAVLVSAAGRLVTKDELLDTVWPKTVVAENNIQVHLSALRKVLGDDRDLIVTIPGRGYQLRQRPVASQARAIDSSFRRSVPLRENGLTGRDTAVQEISLMLQTAQVLTLTGAGGIGKTSLAMEVARQALSDFSCAVCFVELATATTEDAVLSEVAQTCGLSTLDAAVDISQLAAALSGRRMLLVLDNAEHVVDVVARMVDALVAQSKVLRVMATSREPLRLMPETVYRVEPLDVPPAHSTHAEIGQFSAVKLFLLRVNSLQQYAGVGSAELHLIGEICRRLDGIPLAIELAAARVVGLGVAGVHRHLHDRFSLLTGGYRTALPRHQTLRATFDWSFSILDPCHQVLFRRLAVFSGGFTFDAMCSVVCDEKYAVADAISGIGDLVAKSLVNIEPEGPVRRYRLAESTSAYALEKLCAEGEQKPIAARHARYVSDCLRPRLADSDTEPSDREIDFRQSLGDARSAFDWAFSQHGDTRIGIELASGLTEALLDAGLVDECCTRAGQAIDALEELPPAAVDSDTEMRLRATLASALTYAQGSVSKPAQLWTEVLTLAGDRGDQVRHAQALWGLWNTMLSSGNIYGSMNYARRFQRFASHRGTAWQIVLGDQLIAISQHCLGEHEQARLVLANARERFDQLQKDPQRDGRFAVDPMVMCNGTLVRITWLQGDTEASLALVDALINQVRSETLEPSLTHVLGAVAIPLALMCGELARATRYIDIMRSQAALHGFTIWLDYCACLGACRDILNGQGAAATALLEEKLDALLSRGFRRLVTPIIVTCAEALIAEGHLAEASRRLNEVLSFCLNNGELFFLPEVWRARGVLAQAEAGDHTIDGNAAQEKLTIAFSCFQESIELSCKQGAKMWQLRASMALASLLHANNRTAEAVELLASLAADFSETGTASDIQALFKFLGALRDHQTAEGIGSRSAGSAATV